MILGRLCNTRRYYRDLEDEIGEAGYLSECVVVQMMSGALTIMIPCLTSRVITLAKCVVTGTEGVKRGAIH
ncbi:hypothetical protein [Vibrio phage J14]|nr:hypothetical protein [Vibrio phage J14]